MNLESMYQKLQQHTPAVLGSRRTPHFAILLPLVEREGEVHILFEVRARRMRRQPGEICFPGGKVDRSDPDERYTAIRETTEELGITAGCVTHVLPLDYLVSASGTIIYPFVGQVQAEGMTPNPGEVEEVFTVPLSHFQQTQPDVHLLHLKPVPEPGFPFHLIPGGENYNWQTRSMEEYFYHYEDKVIWGLTARILQHFLEIIHT
ncbi:NUDIX hydrolase [Ectobacillus ponti]|uniref:CoA pyrophosphatase n=1 Tax=Ectobacillus ponti TaxID=2961894 RepID=A0AA41X8R0_9BACI|nr:CoA pyrophosphatase [Ectobacillus ponti]MCP8970792.1 CoA pyrophosphatase [Ectobacillus ponti]